MGESVCKRVWEEFLEEDWLGRTGEDLMGRAEVWGCVDWRNSRQREEHKQRLGSRKEPSAFRGYDFDRCWESDWRSGREGQAGSREGPLAGPR